MKPHQRLISCFILGLIVSTIQSPLWLASFASLAFFSFIVIQQPLNHYLRLLKINLFCLLVWLALCWEFQYTYSGYHLVWSIQGIHLALLISLKFNIIYMLGQWLIANLSHLDLILGFKQLKISEKMTALLILTLNYIEVFQVVKHNQDRAMKARGFHPKLSCRIFNIMGLRIALLLIQALEKTESLTRALKARGFKFSQSKDRLNEPNKNL